MWCNRRICRKKSLSKWAIPAELPDIEEPQLAESARQSRVFAAHSARGPRRGWFQCLLLAGLGRARSAGHESQRFSGAVESLPIDEALDKAEGVKNQAAEFLGIKRTTLIEKLKKRNP